MNPILLRLAPYAVTAGVAGVIAWQVQGWRLEARLEALKRTHAEALATAQIQARAKEQQLAITANRVAEKQDAELRKIRGALDTAIGQLRQRPSRAELPPAATTCQAATGAELSAEDAEFLAREAARADELRAALSACYDQYETLAK